MTSAMDRLVAWWDALAGAARRARVRLAALARDPLRVLPVLAVVALLALSIPLTVTGLMRVGRATLDWRANSAIHWRRADATVTRVRIDDGLVVSVAYRDAAGGRHRASAFVGDAGGRWIDRDVRIRYDTRHPARVEIVGIEGNDPVLGLLQAGAPLGAGLAGLVLAVAVWRRRRLLAVSAHPLQILRRPLILGAAILLAGVAAWAVGTVLDQGWSAVASAFGHLVSTVFGDLLGVLVPLVAFVLGALMTAWLARHRHHTDHDDILSSAHRLIDRAAGMVPSPDDLRAARDRSDHEPPEAGSTAGARVPEERTVTPS
jgi:hypothetical protein